MTFQQTTETSKTDMQRGISLVFSRVAARNSTNERVRCTAAASYPTYCCLWWHEGNSRLSEQSNKHVCFVDFTESSRHHRRPQPDSRQTRGVSSPPDIVISCSRSSGWRPKH